jgi:TonB family protein
VPIDITASEVKEPDLIAHVDLLKQLDSVDPGEFKPNSRASLMVEPRSTLVLREGALEGLIELKRIHPLSRPEPVYPAAAAAVHAHGVVKLRALIGTDGRVQSVQVVTGQPTLRQAALDAVWKWRFEPYLSAGRPAQVLAIISVRL